MSETIKLPPFKWEMYRAVAAGPAIKMIENYARLAVEQALAAEREAIVDEWHDRVQQDLENGVKWLNEEACKKFYAEYPQTSSFGEWLNKRAESE